MATAKTATASSTRNRPASHPLYLNEGLSTKKTAFIIVTVVGCIAILWPKVFHPMMFGSEAPKPNIKDRGPGAIRQERPAHLHPESIYQAMRERGRAIPANPTIPILERKTSPSNPPPRIVEGRPGPIPGMRPPMGAGALQQPQAKGNSMGFIMPLYTIGIICFFGYTIMKIVFKKPVQNAPYGPAPTDPKFRREVFGQDGSQVEDLNGSKLGHFSTTASSRGDCNELLSASLSAANVASNLSSSLKQQQQQHQQQQYHHHTHHPTNKSPAAVMAPALFNKETDQLMEIEKLRRKLEDTEKAMAKLIAEMNSDQYEAKKSNENSTTAKNGNISNGHIEDNNSKIENIDAHAENQGYVQRKRREGSTDRSVASKDLDDIPPPQSIYLEGSLAHDSQILVADSETKTEEVFDEELNGSADEPAVVLSSKMTLSLINLDGIPQQISVDKTKTDLESPLADDIEIIGHDEN